MINIKVLNFLSGKGFYFLILFSDRKIKTNYQKIGKKSTLLVFFFFEMLRWSWRHGVAKSGCQPHWFAGGGVTILIFKKISKFNLRVFVTTQLFPFLW